LNIKAIIISLLLTPSQRRKEVVSPLGTRILHPTTFKENPKARTIGPEGS